MKRPDLQHSTSLSRPGLAVVAAARVIEHASSFPIRPIGWRPDLQGVRSGLAPIPVSRPETERPMSDDTPAPKCECGPDCPCGCQQGQPCRCGGEREK